MTIAALVGLVIGIVTILLIARTVKLQRLATDHALNASTAAQKTLQAERAWLLPDGSRMERASIRDSTWNGQPFEGEQLRLPIINFGTTVGRNIRFRAEQFDRPAGQAEPTELAFGHDPRYEGDVAPRSQACGILVFIDEGLRADLELGHRRLFLLLQIDYQDVIDPKEQRTTRRCFEVEWQGRRVLDPLGNTVAIWGFRPLEAFTITE
jgi:hypothetical protein